LKPSWIQKLLASRYAWSAASGLLLSASFPKFSLAGAAWIAPGCLLFSALGKRGWEAARIGFVGGLAFALASLHWLLFIPFPAGAIAGWLALSAYLAFYPAVWVWLCWSAFPARQDHQHPADFVAGPLAGRVLWAIASAALWVGLEMILARLFTGFPWNLLGVSQYQILPVIQIAEVTGVYGVSFLVAWFSVSLASACLSLATNPTRPKPWLGDLVLPLFAVIGVVAFGSWQVANPRSAERTRTLEAVLVQPSIPQTLIWDTNQNVIRFRELTNLSDRALSQNTNAQLLVWPEAAVPNLLRYDRETFTAVTNLAFRHHVWVILVSDDAVPHADSEQSEPDYFNSSFLMSPAGDIVAGYHKRQLVIFGEYVPLEHWLPFMKYLTPIGGSFARGQEAGSFAIPKLRAKTSVLICFEDIFPQLARQDVQPDTDFLLNLTNDGWFGQSAAQWQHAANALFRAVENRVPLVRCANNGLTCWVDADGRMRQVSFDGSNDIYQTGFKTVEIPLLPPGGVRSPTFYTRHGDWFGWGCVAVSGLMLVGAVRKQRGFRRG
jgi:apolipoprotein N-acyltransferase